VAVGVVIVVVNRGRVRAGSLSPAYVSVVFAGARTMTREAGPQTWSALYKESKKSWTAADISEEGGVGKTEVCKNTNAIVKRHR